MLWGRREIILRGTHMTLLPSVSAVRGAAQSNQNRGWETGSVGRQPHRGASLVVCMAAWLHGWLAGASVRAEAAAGTLFAACFAACLWGCQRGHLASLASLIAAAGRCWTGLSVSTKTVTGAASVLNTEQPTKLQALSSWRSRRTRARDIVSGR